MNDEIGTGMIVILIVAGVAYLVFAVNVVVRCVFFDWESKSYACVGKKSLHKSYNPPSWCDYDCDACGVASIRMRLPLDAPYSEWWWCEHCHGTGRLDKKKFIKEAPDAEAT